MKDGLQNVPIDRMLMRVKDVLSIFASILQVIISIGTIIFVVYSFFTKIDALTSQISILQRQQSATQQIVTNSPLHQKRRVNEDADKD